MPHRPKHTANGHAAGHHQETLAHTECERLPVPDTLAVFGLNVSEGSVMRIVGLRYWWILDVPMIQSTDSLLVFVLYTVNYTLNLKELKQ